jgi:hypothetical protein
MKTTSPPSVEKKYNKITLFDNNDIVRKPTGATIKNSPVGMISFVRSVSPDRTKKRKPLCSLCLGGECLIFVFSILRAFVIISFFFTLCAMRYLSRHSL